MSDASLYASKVVVSNKYPSAPGFAVFNTHWGYVLRRTGRPSHLQRLSQAGTLGFGTILCAAAVALVVLPELVVPSMAALSRIAIGMICASLAVYLFWLARRGVSTEWHIDCGRGEVREVFRGRSGTTGQVARFGFDAIGAVFLERSAARPSRGALVLRFGNTAQRLRLVEGQIAALEDLRDRLGRDLILDPDRMHRL